MRKKNEKSLLQQSVDTHLSPKEQAELSAYQQSDEGQLITAVHEKLSSDLRLNAPETVMNKHRVHALAKQIDDKVQQKQRRQRVVQTTRNFALATAVFVLAFVGINWLLFPPYVPEMATIVTVAPTRIVVPTDVGLTATPIPTAVLKSGMRYVDLTTEEPVSFAWIPEGMYTKSIAEVQAEAGYDLFLPTQLGKNFRFVGAMYNPRIKSVEVAFMTNVEIRGDYPLWILSQKPFVADTEETSVLTLMLQPYADVEHEIVPMASSTLEVYGSTGLFEGREINVAIGEWTAVNQLWWRSEEQQFSFTMIAPANINGNTLADIAHNFVLEPVITNQ